MTRTVNFRTWLATAAIAVFLFIGNAVGITINMRALEEIKRARASAQCDGYFMAALTTRVGRDEMRRRLGASKGALDPRDYDNETDAATAILLNAVDDLVLPPMDVTIGDADAGTSVSCKAGVVEPEPAEDKPAPSKALGTVS